MPGAFPWRASHELERDNYHGLCEASVYGGYRFCGIARSTIVRGGVMMDEFETVGVPSWGRYVPHGAAAGGGL